MLHAATLGRHSRSTGSTTFVRHLLRNRLFSAEGRDQLYLHIAPCGDWWTGQSIFAAKHLQPDYVKSIPHPSGFNSELVFDSFSNTDTLMKQMYDESMLSTKVLDRFYELQKQQRR